MLYPLSFTMAPITVTNDKVGSSMHEEIKDATATAQAAALAEHSRSFWRSLKEEWRSALWSVAVSTAMHVPTPSVVDSRSTC